MIKYVQRPIWEGTFAFQSFQSHDFIAKTISVNVEKRLAIYLHTILQIMIMIHFW